MENRERSERQSVLAPSHATRHGVTTIRRLRRSCAKEMVEAYNERAAMKERHGGTPDRLPRVAANGLGPLILTYGSFHRGVGRAIVGAFPQSQFYGVHLVSHGAA